RGSAVVVLRIYTEYARGLGRPVATHEHRAEGDRHFAEDGARKAPAQRSFDAVEQLDDLELPRENRVERAVPALGNGEFSDAEMQIGGGFREALELGNAERREQRNGPDVVNGQHGSVECGCVRPSVSGKPAGAKGRQRGFTRQRYWWGMILKLA